MPTQLELKLQHKTPRKIDPSFDHLHLHDSEYIAYQYFGRKIERKKNEERSFIAFW